MAYASSTSSLGERGEMTFMNSLINNSERGADVIQTGYVIAWTAPDKLPTVRYDLVNAIYYLIGLMTGHPANGALACMRENPFVRHFVLSGQAFSAGAFQP